MPGLEKSRLLAFVMAAMLMFSLYLFVRASIYRGIRGTVLSASHEYTPEEYQRAKEINRIADLKETHRQEWGIVFACLYFFLPLFLVKYPKVLILVAGLHILSFIYFLVQGAYITQELVVAIAVGLSYCLLAINMRNSPDRIAAD